MRKEVKETLSNMTVYEKFELFSYILEEQKQIYAELENFRHRTDQYNQGMLLAKESHGLNSLVVNQLETINELSSNCKFR